MKVSFTIESMSGILRTNHMPNDKVKVCEKPEAAEISIGAANLDRTILLRAVLQAVSHC